MFIAIRPENIDFDQHFHIISIGIAINQFNCKLPIFSLCLCFKLGFIYKICRSMLKFYIFFFISFKEQPLFFPRWLFPTLQHSIVNNFDNLLCHHETLHQSFLFYFLSNLKRAPGEYGCFEHKYPIIRCL